MSTFRILSFVVASCALFGAAIAHSHVQGGKGPINVSGPSYVSAGATNVTYGVTVSDIMSSKQNSGKVMDIGDTYVTISVDNSAFHPSVTTLRVPAGTSTAYFTVNVDTSATGDCEITASNANSTASRITVVN